jgi:uncharacterized protein (DUF362 family)
MDPLVVISKGRDPYTTARTALRRFPLPDLNKRRILIKPNAARLASPGEGVTTNPLVISATIDHLREYGAKEITIGEGFIFGVEARAAFDKTGMKEVSQSKGVKLINLDQFDPEERIIPGGKFLKKIRVSSAMNDFDWVVSIPVMKTHMHTRVSLSIKNMKGLLWRREKARLHQLRSNQKSSQTYKTLDLAISEMAILLRPDLAIIDGTVGMEGMGPAYGKPKKMGVVLVSDHALSADAVAARMMGLNPDSIPHLKLCSERGMGEIQLQKITIKPKDYLKWEVPFEPSPSTLSISYPDVVLYDEGSCSGCLSTLLVFLREYHSQLNDYHLKDKNIHIGIGKHLKICPEGTILVGNCTAKMKRRGIYVQGCPPVSSQIMEALSQSKRALSSYPSWDI